MDQGFDGIDEDDFAGEADAAGDHTVPEYMLAADARQSQPEVGDGGDILQVHVRIGVFIDLRPRRNGKAQGRQDGQDDFGRRSHRPLYISS